MVRVGPNEDAVRVLGLDTPSLGTEPGAASAQCGSREALAYADGRLTGQTVTLVPDPTLPERDDSAAPGSPTSSCAASSTTPTRPSPTGSDGPTRRARSGTPTCSAAEQRPRGRPAWDLGRALPEARPDSDARRPRPGCATARAGRWWPLGAAGRRRSPRASSDGVAGSTAVAPRPGGWAWSSSVVLGVAEVECCGRSDVGAAVPRGRGTRLGAGRWWSRRGQFGDARGQAGCRRRLGQPRRPRGRRCSEPLEPGWCPTRCRPCRPWRRLAAALPSLSVPLSRTPPSASWTAPSSAGAVGGARRRWTRRAEPPSVPSSDVEPDVPATTDRRVRRPGTAPRRRARPAIWARWSAARWRSGAGRADAVLSTVAGGGGDDRRRRLARRCSPAPTRRRRARARWRRAPATGRARCGRRTGSRRATGAATLGRARPPRAAGGRDARPPGGGGTATAAAAAGPPPAPSPGRRLAGGRAGQRRRRGRPRPRGDGARVGRRGLGGERGLAQADAHRRRRRGGRPGRRRSCGRSG